ncbi:MAG: hypothetical protein J0M24_27160 [Verrucomicrobia bacterium]|nr:hypothetical protein [Verrucomicrobiota bacterium]
MVNSKPADSDGFHAGGDTAALFPHLMADPSAKVRSKAAGDRHDSKRRWVVSLLSDRRLVETDPLVVDSIDFAISKITKSRT